MAIMGFLATLPSDYDSAKSQILSNLKISSLQDTFNRILHTENSSPAHPPTQLSSALVGRNIGESGKQRYINSGLGSDTRGPSS